MRIGFLVNDLKTEESGYTTSRLAINALKRGHEAWVFAVGDLSYDLDEKIHAFARMAPGQNYKKGEQYLNDLIGPKARAENITIDDLDILMLRNDPSGDKELWKQMAGLDFGRIAMRHGVIVLNDPAGLSKAMNKAYFQTFPEQVRPKTIITRKRERLAEFIDEVGGQAILKPLQGSGGSGVFKVTKDDKSNLNQIIESLATGGYIIGQEYLQAAAVGDIRLFMMNGVPLKYKGKYAAFQRLRQGDDIRSNIHAGGKKEAAIITDEHLELAEMVRPKLVQDGMFLVGLDIVGNKLMEINVFSPGGLGSAKLFEKVNFSDAVIDSFENKVRYMSYYRRNFDNREMTTL